VLHSPLLSGIRVMLPIERTLFIDPFPNIEWIKTVVRNRDTPCRDRASCAVLCPPTPMPMDELCPSCSVP
jgi:hypothetical protein